MQTVTHTKFGTGILLSVLLIVVVSSGLFFSNRLTAHAMGATFNLSHANGSTNWPTYGFDSEHSHYNSFENTINTSNVSQLKLDWTATTHSAVYGPPIVVNGTLYVSSPDKSSVNALNAATGAMLWSRKVGDTISAPAIANGVLYDGSAYLKDRGNTSVGKLFALNAQTGAILWTYDFLPVQTGGSSWIHTSPVVSNGLVYVSSENGNLYAFTAAGCGHSTCPPVWKARTGNFIDSAPAFDNGVVYVGSGDDSVYAFDATTGAKLWSTPTGGYIFASPTIANGIVYVGSFDNNIYALDAKTGTVLWKFATNKNGFSDVAVANGVVYFGGATLYALNAQTGTQLWTSTSTNLGEPVVANGVVYVGSGGLAAYDALYAFNAAGCGQATCSPLWTYPTLNITNPIIVNGVVYASLYFPGDAIDAFHLG